MGVGSVAFRSFVTQGQGNRVGLAASETSPPPSRAGAGPATAKQQQVVCDPSQVRLGHEYSPCMSCTRLPSYPPGTSIAYSACIPRLRPRLCVCRARVLYYRSIARAMPVWLSLTVRMICHAYHTPTLPRRSYLCDGLWSERSARTRRARRSMPPSPACLHASCGRCEQRQLPRSPLPSPPRLPPIKNEVRVDPTGCPRE